MSKFKIGQIVTVEGYSKEYVILASWVSSHYHNNQPHYDVRDVYGNTMYDIPESKLKEVNQEKKVPKFKVGDYVRILPDNDPLKVEEVYTLTSGIVKFKVGGYYYEAEALELTSPNGQDVEGNPLHFTVEDLKVGMRIAVNGFEPAIVMLDPSSGKPVAVNTAYYQFTNFGFFKKHIDLNVSVYAPPNLLSALINPRYKGKLLWKNTRQKSEREIELEERIIAHKNSIKLSVATVEMYKAELQELRNSNGNI